MYKTSLSKISKLISSGLTPLRSNDEFWINGDIPWLKTEQLGTKYIYDTTEKISTSALENTSIKLNKKNTISIAMYGEGKTRGSVSIIKKEMATNQACCNIYIDEDLAHYEFIYYFLKTQYEQLRNLSSGVRKNLNSNDIKNFEVNIPKDINIQKKTANILSSLDKKIELNNKINKELESMSKTLYDYWFVQFDFPNENGKPYKSSAGKMVYNEELKRDIPDGWGVDDIENILSKNETKVQIQSKEILTKGKYPVIDQSSKFISGYTNNDLSIINTKMAPKIIFGDHTRIIKLINFNFARGADGTQIMLSQYDSMPQHLFYYSLLQIDLSNYGYARHFKFLKQSKIVLPNKNIADDFENIVKIYYQKIRENIFQNQELENLRDWLLPMLMNGQVSVK